MRIGLQIPAFTWPGGPPEIAARLAEIAQRSEAAGLYSLWVMDHYFQIRMIGDPELDMLEGWETLAYLAGITKTIRLGTLVTGVTYRHPGLLVKISSTLDVLTSGRSYLGIGAAWNEDEHRGLGVPYPPVSERFERLEETLQIIHQMWRDDDSPYHGKWYQLDRPLNHPMPLQHPHPPLLIGGSGEQKTLRLVAQYANACNLFAAGGTEILAHKLQVLKDHCERLERPYDAIEKTASAPLVLDGSDTPKAQVTAAVSLLNELAELGITHTIISLPNVTEAAPFELLAEIVSQVTQT